MMVPRLNRLYAAVLIAIVCPWASVASAADPGDSNSAAGAQSDKDLTLKSVVVTAQRREEVLQNVPISVTSITGKSIENSGYQDFTHLQYLVPGLQYDPTQGSAFQIRGVGSTSFDFSNAKSVNVVVDDVVMDGQRINGLTGLYDLQQVDVLMGPQGTLFGKNSTSGVISVTTGKPVLNDTEYRVNASYGSRADRVVNATVNLPISATTAFRLTAFDRGQDGYGRYVTLNEKLGTVKENGFRAKFLVKPTSDLEVLFSADYAYHWDTSIRTAVSGAPANVTAQEIALGVNPGPQNADTADSSRGMIETKEWGSSLKVDYKIGSNTLTSVTAFRGTRYNNDTPADLLPGNLYAYIPYNQGRLGTHKFSQEVRLASPTGQFIEYVAGVFYNTLQAEQSQLQWATLGAPTVNADGTLNNKFYALTGAIGQKNTALFDARNTTAAAFGQLKFNLSERASVSVGGRYTKDQNSQSLGYFDTPPGPVTGVNNVIFTATSAPPLYPAGTAKGENFSFRVAPQYKLSDETMVYTSFTTGYKPAGIAFVGNKYDPYLAETVQSIEVGEKSEFFNRRLRVNANLFSARFKDFQATVLTTIPGSATLQSVIGNAGLLTTQGVELNAAYRATSSLDLNGAITYADAKFNNYVFNTTTNYSGTRLTNAPQLSATIGVNYRTMVTADVRMNASLDYTYRGKVWTVVGQPAYSEVPAFSLVNGRVGFRGNDSNFEYGVFGRNLFNKYFSTGWQQYGALGLLHYTSPAALRTVGVYGSYSF